MFCLEKNETVLGERALLHDGRLEGRVAQAIAPCAGLTARGAARYVFEMARNIGAITFCAARH